MTRRAIAVCLAACALLAGLPRAAAEEPQKAPAAKPDATAPAPATPAAAATAPAPAEPTAAPSGEAKREFDEGRTHYAAAEFSEAAAHFERAYELTHAPELLYNLARCYEHLDEPERAVEQYQMYLRMSPDAEDRAEVEQKIALLQEEADAAQKGAPAAAAGDSAAPEKAGAGSKVWLGASSGFDIPITGEWDRKSVPVDAVLLFGLNGWLRAGFGLSFVGFVGDEPVGRSQYPTGEFALHGDLAGQWTIKGRFAFAARLSIAPTWIFRAHQDSALWLAGRLGAGLHIDVWSSFGVLVEAVGAVGPVLNVKHDRYDNWPTVSLAADAGGRLGITYGF